jgi:hypothetical protein
MAGRPAAFKQGDVTKALKAVRAAGMNVVRTEIAPDGKIVLVHGDPDHDPAYRDRSRNEWDGAT